MSIDATKPTDQELVSMLPYWIRRNATAINSIVAGLEEFTLTRLSLTAGTTALVIGVDLTAIALEVILLDSPGLCHLEQIRGGTEGQVKLIIFQGNSVDLIDGPKETGKFYLNQLPVGSTFSAQRDDVIALVNVEGDGGSIYGYWKEVWRQVSVK